VTVFTATFSGGYALVGCVVVIFNHAVKSIFHLDKQAFPAVFDIQFYVFLFGVVQLKIDYAVKSGVVCVAVHAAGFLYAPKQIGEISGGAMVNIPLDVNYLEINIYEGGEYLTLNGNANTILQLTVRELFNTEAVPLLPEM